MAAQDRLKDTLQDTLQSALTPIADTADVGALLERVGGARAVLLGEASHGTHEFYALRAELTRRLIAERGFAAVAVEADWPDAHRVNRFVRGRSDDPDARAALGDFRRFPTWMWRNTVVADFVDWLRDHNRGAGRPAGFYGLDLYSLYTSIDAVVTYLDRVDPEAAARARQRYACFEHTSVDGQRYGYAAATGRQEPCEDAVVAQLVELQRTAAGHRDGDDEALFDAEQNARLVADAEAYYRSMFRGRVESWNRRDRHMAATLERLLEHLGGRVEDPKVVVWAHNSHLGDARATELGHGGELNLGQLVRERHGEDACLVGFTTHHGEVTAASDWDAPMERKRVRPALAGSYEDVLHATGRPRFWLDLRDPAVAAPLDDPRLERAIGVIYRPETERVSHWFEARLPAQFDLVIHLDETTALEPLDRSAGWEAREPAETYPWAV
jgi:erythromycin esterase-like protein